MKSPHHLYLVYEFCNEGTLEGMISKNKTFTETAALKIFKQLLTAFEILQKQHIVHRDVKPENIFFNNGKAKLGDFGFCKSLLKNKTCNNMVGISCLYGPRSIKIIKL
jgi:serine/threonine protein kinase